MTFAFRESQRIKKEGEFVYLLKNAKKIKNDFFFVLFEERPIRQQVRHFR
jgi:RNase P protein component